MTSVTMRVVERGPYVLVCCAFVLGVSMTHAASRAQAGPAIKTNLCALAAHPKRFNGKTVRVGARAESAVIEGGTWLYDDSCESHPLELLLSDKAREHPDFRALRNAIVHEGTVGTIGKTITGTFTGRFRWHSRGRVRRVLSGEKVENLEVKLSQPPK